MGAAVTPAMYDAHLLSASAAAKLIQSGELTVEHYVEALLQRIDERDEDVKAWAFLDRDQVLANARALDALAADQRGPLHGVVIGVKDVIYTKDMPTEFNSPIYKGHFPQVDAASIAILRASGALFLGKTVTTEFAATANGPGTFNPHDITRTPGGSSAGSGAAVGDFQVPVALGTQTGGSTIRPAAYCGIYGFKPTWGAVSREGQKFFSLTFDTLGIFSRHVDDLILMADAFKITDDQPSSFQSLEGARFALIKSMLWPAAEPATRDALARGAEILRSHGAIVEEIELPKSFEKLPQWYNVVLDMEGSKAFLPEYSSAVEQLDSLMVGYVENKSKYTQRQYVEALDNMAALRPQFEALVNGYDAVLTPSTPDEAPVGTDTGSYLFCKIWTGLHVPVVNIPGFGGPNNMPVGLSLVAPRYHDQHLLSVTSRVGPLFEAEGGWERPVHSPTVHHEANGHDRENGKGNGNGHL